MSNFRNKIYYLISGNVPDYIVSEYPQFVTFLEAYYKFLEIEGNYTTTLSNPNNLLLNSDSWNDIDNSLDIFIKQYRLQQSFDIPETALLDAKRILKFIHFYYEGKGSENSAKLFFKFMYNEDITLSYPGNYILRASDGVWKRKKIVKLDTTNFNENPFDLIKKQIQFRFVDNVPTIGKQLKTVTANCLDVIKKVGTSLYSLEIDISEDYEFPTTIVSPGTITATNYPLGLNPTTYSATGFDINGDGINDTINLLDLYYDTFIYVVYNQKIYGALTKQIVSIDSIDVDGSNFQLDDSYILQEKTTYFTPSTDVVGNYIYLETDNFFKNGDLVQLSISNVLPNNDIVEKPPFTGIPGGGTGVNAYGYYFVKRSATIQNAYQLLSSYNHSAGTGNPINLDGSSVYGLNLTGSTIRRKLTLAKLANVDSPGFAPTLIDRKNDSIVRVTQTSDIGANQGVFDLDIVDSGSKFICRDLTDPTDFNLNYFSGDYSSSLTPIKSITTATIPIEPKYPRKSGEVAYITFNTSPILKQQGYFKDSSGFLSDINKIQDNYFYQPYSYVVRTQNSQEKWKNVYLKSNHPAGFKLFTELQIVDIIPIFTQIDVDKVIQVIIEDAITVTDTGITKNILTEIYIDTYWWDYSEPGYVEADGTTLSDEVLTSLS